MRLADRYNKIVVQHDKVVDYVAAATTNTGEVEVDNAKGAASRCKRTIEYSSWQEPKQGEVGIPEQTHCVTTDDNAPLRIDTNCVGLSTTGGPRNFDDATVAERRI